MADQITAATANSDGSYTFDFLFDSGTGVFGASVVNLPAPVAPAAAYTMETAAAAVLPLAAAQKAAWLATFAAQPIIGDVTL